MKRVIIIAVSAIVIAGCGGTKSETKAGSEFRGYTPSDRTLTCAVRWNDWVVTPDGHNATAPYVQLGIQRNGGLVTLSGLESLGAIEKPSRFRPTNCAVAIWESSNDYIRVMFTESYRSPNFSFFSYVYRYPTLPPDEPTDGISDVRFTDSGDGTLTLP
jgi:hypothetical protein